MKEYRIRKLTYPSGVWYVADRKILGIWVDLSKFSEDERGCSPHCDTNLERLIESLRPDKYLCTSEVVWP